MINTPHPALPLKGGLSGGPTLTRPSHRQAPGARRGSTGYCEIERATVPLRGPEMAAGELLDVDFISAPK
jgi:hypothetical protein